MTFRGQCTDVLSGRNESTFHPYSRAHTCLSHEHPISTCTVITRTVGHFRTSGAHIEDVIPINKCSRILPQAHHDRHTSHSIEHPHHTVCLLSALSTVACLFAPKNDVPSFLSMRREVYTVRILTIDRSTGHSLHSCLLTAHHVCSLHVHQAKSRIERGTDHVYCRGSLGSICPTGCVSRCNVDIATGCLPNWVL